ncbi:fatty acid synthase [Plakobranchus ocellatus]|uniref:Fatty acid synthase n=1 Tax=Plakobranchus ocellatus TaxID=259542 RepID=A0AAV4DSW6_9GAST|nr:fatty acid synthase [Plakobranchus ocellatus]
MKCYLRPGDNLLIMDGLDPMGQAITRVASHMGVKVIATVQTETDKDLVTRIIPDMDLDRVVCRHGNLGYVEQVARLAGKKGIHVIISTLTTEESRDILMTLNSDGVFLYIGEHGNEELQNLSNGTISIQRVNIPTILCDSDERAVAIRQDLAALVSDGIKEGIVKPLNSLILPATDTTGIFAALTTENWIQQLVVKIQDEEETQHRQSPALMVRKHTQFHSDRCYLLVGSLDWFVLELAYWMVRRGARHLLISSRDGETSAYHQCKINMMAELRPEVKVTTETAMTLEGAARLLYEASQIGPLGGVFTITMTQEQKQPSNWTWAQIISNLDESTRAASENKDVLFVVCSSTETFQSFDYLSSTYSFAQASVHRICERRCDDGLHGLAIQCGPIDFNNNWPQSLHEILEAFDKTMCQEAPIVKIYQKQCMPALADGNQKLKEIPEKKEKTLIEKVLDIIGLKTSPDNKVTLNEAGIDSMGTTEVQQLVQNEVGLNLDGTGVRALTFGKLKEMRSEDVTRIKELEKFQRMRLRST